MNDIDTLSRVVLVTACAVSTIAAASIAVLHRTNYGPHMALVAVMSVVFGLGMSDLAFAGFDMPFIPDVWLIASLNSSSTVCVGGWAVYGFRKLKDERRNLRAVEQAEAEVVRKIVETERMVA